MPPSLNMYNAGSRTLETHCYNSTLPNGIALQ